MDRNNFRPQSPHPRYQNNQELRFSPRFRQSPSPYGNPRSRGLRSYSPSGFSPRFQQSRSPYSKHNVFDYRHHKENKFRRPDNIRYNTPRSRNYGGYSPLPNTAPLNPENIENWISPQMWQDPWQELLNPDTKDIPGAKTAQLNSENIENWISPQMWQDPWQEPVYPDERDTMIDNLDNSKNNPQCSIPLSNDFLENPIPSDLKANGS